jgi:transcriptional regulator with XRE-family HTH domain
MDLDLTQPEVANRLGVTRESVDNWEHDVHPPKANHVRAIHDFLGYCPVGLGLPHLGARLLTWRKAAGLTQREVAERIGCDETTLRDLERGRTNFLHWRIRDAIDRVLDARSS